VFQGSDPASQIGRCYRCVSRGEVLGSEYGAGGCATEILACVVLALLLGLVLASLVTVLERKVLASGQRRSGPS